MEIKTYTSGFTLKAERDITKDDFISFCKSLNNNYAYSDDYEFEPEPIGFGGIKYKFKDNSHNPPGSGCYKSVRLGLCRGESKAKWPWVPNNWLCEWSGNNDIIIPKNDKFTLFLKSFRGAPAFTLKELKIWNNCFNQIGIVRVSKYPSKESLIHQDIY